MGELLAAIGMAFGISACGGGGDGGGGGGTCGEGETTCSGACVDLQSDPANCGGCGEACAQGASCVDGDCVTKGCEPGLFECEDGVCHNLGVDPFHCGTCGNACGADEICLAGLCETQCPPEQSDCDGACVDLQTDPAHCGECGGACGGGDVCSAGECSASCKAGLTNCGGACVDTQTDRSFCGGCKTACSDAENCVAGVCEVPTTGCSPDAVDLEEIGDSMVGCAGMVAFESAASLCGEGWHVCSARDWSAGNSDRGPRYNYWVSDALLYNGEGDRCWVSEREGQSCTGGGYYGPSGGPMHVCVDGGRDGLDNTCNWSSCGYGAAPPPNEFFGGCSGDWTAGALCCR